MADLHVTASDTVAYCHALLKLVDSTARLTMGLRRAWAMAGRGRASFISLHVTQTLVDSAPQRRVATSAREHNGPKTTRVDEAQTGDD